MKHTAGLSLLFVLLYWMSLPVVAETVYINDRFMVGMHEDSNLDSVIMKLLPSGTSLDVIKKDEPMSQVREPDGDIGWVDNQYLVSEKPGRAQLAAAEKRIAELEQALEKAGGDRAMQAQTQAPESEVVQQLTNENRELQQLLKTERLRVGELQAETAELKNRLSGTVRPDEAVKELEKLKSVNANLREQLQDLRSMQGQEEKQASLAEEIDIASMLGDFDWKKMLITIAVSLIIGIAIGLYLLDWIQRRRHGGFRI